ncbi:serine hydrolase [Paenibacillus mesophilus]|uniref:serine hydrolase domain-containing protein n=1 Tax=Paenibacillus mesophilus TaxID=2582849 RepID=UPI00110F47FF|nr:serine hydrolase [Paenibacillus mesophilus]TMV43933.1 serine hydrolase [Paenibacillus mesophilus]
MSNFYFPSSETKDGWRTLVHNDDISSLGIDLEATREFVDWNMEIQSVPPARQSPLSVLVIKDGWIVSERYDRPETKYTPTWTASMGKTMTACMVSKWIEDSSGGRIPIKINLESPVYDIRYLPEGFPLSDPRKNLITFTHILNHTSGLRPSPEVFQGENFLFVPYTVGHCEHYPDSMQLYSEPGIKFGYSNVGYNHLAVISPHLTGVQLHTSIENHLFSPIGIEKTSWYSGGPSYLWGEKIYQPSCAGPDMTSRDLARFAYLLLRNGKWEDQQIVASWYLDEMKKVSWVQLDYGLGLRSNTNGSLSTSLPKDAFVLSGAGLNVAMVVPSWDLIVIRMSQVHSFNSKKFLGEFLEKSKSIIRGLNDG